MDDKQKRALRKVVASNGLVLTLDCLAATARTQALRYASQNENDAARDWQWKAQVIDGASATILEAQPLAGWTGDRG